MITAGSILLAYLIGSIPTGLLLAKALKGIDIREHGSKNIGATNVFRVVGKKWGIVVLLIDASKGAAAVILPPHLMGFDAPVYFPVVLGVATLLGNTFPVWLKFKGGKGVATSLGVFTGIAPAPALTAFVFWCAVFASTRILSVASLAAAIFFPISIWFFLRGQALFTYLFPVGLFLAVFIFYTHRANVGRLMRGEEKKLI